MDHFIDALISKEKSTKIPEADNYFGALIGSWKLDYIDYNISCSITGEWHFAWILEGMAIQDVIVLPSHKSDIEIQHPLTEYGTTLRIYNPVSEAWDIAYGYTGKIIRLKARKQNDMIILENIDDMKQNWVFVKIEENYFHWQNITIQDDGTWHTNAEIMAKRI